MSTIKDETEGKPAPTEDGAMPPAARNGEAVSTDENGTAVSNAKPENAKPSGPEIEYPTGLKLALLMTSIFVGMFLVSLVCQP